MSRLIERRAHKNPRLLVFYGLVIGLVFVLTSGLAYRQLLNNVLYAERERMQNLRRIVSPGPRGNIFDRDGRVLVGNRPRFSVVLDLAELRGEFRAAYKTISRNYAGMVKGERPNEDQISRIARTSVAQKYLNQVNTILHRHEQVNSDELNRHFAQTLLLPYVLLDDVAAEEYARLLERLPVDSPLQVYTFSSRNYPFGALAAHTLGYVGVDNDPEVEDFPGEDLRTFKLKGSVGRAGLELVFDTQLEGEAGGAIYRVDPAGYKIDLPIEKRMPIQGKNIAISIDVDLQQAAENAMRDGEGNPRMGSAVALDVRTGEVLVLASKPDYDPLTRVPNLPAGADVGKSGVWLNRAIQGRYPPGSTFKIINAIAGLRAGTIEPDTSRIICPGFIMVGNRRFPCAHGAMHGDVDLIKAISKSCNVFFIKYGLDTTPEFLATEAKRFGFNTPTGIELPGEFKTPRVADPEWRRENWRSANLPDGIWRGGDTANIAIGQGDTLITPLQAACMVASFARGETETKPTLLHDPKRAPQRSEPIGLPPAAYNAILEGMKQCYQIGTGKLARVDELSGAAKSGTAQKGRIEVAWLVCFAPVENPQIAIAVALEGDEGENFGGGAFAGPVAHAILTAWKEKQERPKTEPVKFGMQ